MERKYFLGLDLGTDSVGWCLTDQDYNVIRKSSKSLWGVRLFEGAEDCKARRLNRCQRRRIERRKARINLLQSLFANEITSKDDKFFQRLEISKYHFEDRREYNENVQTLFVEEDFNDKHYYDRFPTIYHLRKTLVDSKEKQDIRFIYLALHHAIKYRGNFLSYGREFSISDPNELYNYFNDLSKELEVLGKEKIEVNEDKIKKVIDLSNRTLSPSKIKEELVEIISVKDKYISKTVFALISGLEVNVTDLYELDKDEYEGEIKKLGFRNDGFDENFEDISKGLDNECIDNIVKISKLISDFIYLGKLLKGEKYLCDAMTKRYQEHQKDLRELKSYVKNNLPDKYSLIFRKHIEKVNNYPTYIGSNNSNNKVMRFAHCKRDEFYKFLREQLGFKYNDSSLTGFFREINEKMLAGVYLERQNTTDNGIYPYQLNLIEVRKIIENQSQYYSFFNEKDDSGLSVKEKIESILTYQIPYYVGPLAYNENNTKNTWVVRKNEKIYPWNISEVVDYEKTSEKFITRMLNKCTYLENEFCLPKNSITYSYYSLLSEINKIRINGSLITYEQKFDLIENLFKKGTVTKNSLVKFFKNKYGSDVVLSTSNDKELEEIKTNLKSYCTFSNILGRDFVDANVDFIDNIIRDITIFPDKKTIEKRLRRDYSITDEVVINKIKTLSYSGYGRLSKRFIDGIKSNVLDIETGEIKEKTILDILKDTNLNLMEIINDSNYDFMKKVDEENGIEKEQIGIKEYVDNLYVSPGMKRPLIQAYRIIEELKKIINHPIDKFYIECTRSNEKKKERKDSRKEKLLKLYKHAEEICKKETETYANEMLLTISKNMERIIETKDLEFRSDKLYLYYRQMGRCMYTGKPLDISQIYNASVCDIDHIIPQKILKDDSLENRVLVLQEANKNKGSIYPIPQSSLFSGHFAFYKYLKNLEFMGAKKLNNLTRLEPLTESEKEQFINRQLVYTNQAVAGLVKMIKKFENVKETDIIYSKAENVSDFRTDFGIVKSRDANNFHHAHDAYLNIIVGRTLETYFGFRATKERIKEIESKKKTLNIRRIFKPEDDYDRSPIKNLQGEIVWNYKETKEKIEDQIFNHFDIMVTTRQYIDRNLFTKVGLIPASESKSEDGLFPIKNPSKDSLESKLSKTSKYGGYNNLKAGFYTLVQSLDKKGKKFYSIEAMQNIFVKPEDSNEKKISYLVNNRGLISPSIIIPTLRINTIVKDKFSKKCITGKTGDFFVVKNLNECIFSKNEIFVINRISKFLSILIEKKVSIKDGEKLSNLFPLINEEYIIVSPAKNKKVKEISISIKELIDFYDELVLKMGKKIYKSFSSLSLIREKLLKNDAKSVFSRLSIYSKIYTLNEMLYLFKCNRVTSDLSLLGLSEGSGVLKISKNITSRVKIIVESVTGYYTKTLFEGGNDEF